MAFYCEHPVVSLADPGKVDTFMVDIFQPRPNFNDMARFQSWGSEANKKIREVMARKTSAVSWVQFVMDQHGFLALLKFGHKLQLGAAKTAAAIIFKYLNDASLHDVEQGLRPLDEVDRDRISGWATIESLRPQGQKRKRAEEEEEEEDTKTFFVPNNSPPPLPPRPEPKVKTARELLAELASDDEGDAEGIELPRLMLTDAADGAALPPSALGRV
jgi:hypothetical protein